MCESIRVGGWAGGGGEGRGGGGEPKKERKSLQQRNLPEKS